MAEGTYGSSPFYQNNINSPIDPSTPNSQFTTNVNRQKTRKWVEAKKATYDGSGWGDEDDEDEDDEEPVPAMPIHPAIAAARNLPSMNASRSASFPVSMHASQPSGSSHGLPSRENTSPQRRDTASPGSIGGDSPNAPGYSTVNRPWTDRSASPLGPRAQSPANAGRRGHFVRPSDIYKRVASSGDTRALSPDTHPAAAARERQASAAAAGSQPAVEHTGPAFAHAADISRTVDSPSPDVFHDFPTPTLTSDSAFPPPPQPATNLPSQTTTSVAPAPVTIISPPEPQSQHKQQPSVDSVDSSSTSGASKESIEHAASNRFSSSPKLPDLARFSTFSPDLLFGDGFLASAPPVPSLPSPGANAPAIYKEEEVTKSQSTTHTASLAAAAAVAAAGAGAIATGSALAGSTSAERDSVNLPDHLNLKHPKDSFSSTGESLAATRDSTATVTTGITSSSSSSEESARAKLTSQLYEDAPSSHDKALQSEREEEDTHETRYSTPPPIAPSALANVPTTAPLNPHRGNINLPDVALPTITTQRERTGTVSTITGSPAKESDKLREEIIRTLSPVKMTTSEPESLPEDATGSTFATGTGAAAESGSAGQRRSEHARTLTRESSYLQSVYDDYWTPEDATPVNEHQPDMAKSAATAAVSAKESHPVVAPLVTSPKSSIASPSGSIGSGGTATTSTGARGVAAGAAVAAATAAIAATAAAKATETRPSLRQASSTSPTSPVYPVSTVAPPVPQTKQAAASPDDSNLRRRFSWEAEPETTAPAVSPTAIPPTLGVAPLATSSSPTREVASPLAEQVPSGGHHYAPAADIQSQNLVSPTSTTTMVYGSGGAPTVSTPSPVSEDVVAMDKINSPTHDTTAEAGALRHSTESRSTTSGTTSESLSKQVTQPPIRSMLDIGDDEPTKAEPMQRQRQRTLTADSVVIPGTASPVKASVELTRTNTRPTTRQSYSSPSASASDYVSADASGQYLTLRQCMAFSTHQERMAKLAETRRQYAGADSGLGGWLSAMTVAPEYSRAAYAPLWDSSTGGAPPSSRPVAPHVNIPSGAQISHKGKEILAATGKAGKGLLALRKKTFHKKATN